MCNNEKKKKSAEEIEAKKIAEAQAIWLANEKNKRKKDIGEQPNER